MMQHNKKGHTFLVFSESSMCEQNCCGYCFAAEQIVVERLTFYNASVKLTDLILHYKSGDIFLSHYCLKSSLFL